MTWVTTPSRWGLAFAQMSEDDRAVQQDRMLLVLSVPELRAGMFDQFAHDGFARGDHRGADRALRRCARTDNAVIVSGVIADGGIANRLWSFASCDRDLSYLGNPPC